MQDQAYFLICSRYIELNPARAGMVADPGEYRGSSYRKNGLGQADERLTPHPEYLGLGGTQAERQAAYRAWFQTELDDAALADIRLALARGQPLGNDRFSARVCTEAGVRRTQARRGRPVQPPRVEAGVEGEQTGFGF